jgi:hypothetical protein
MTISSRTPEGLPNQCPVCRNEVRIGPSQPFGDAPCPHCGTLLWFLGSSGPGEVMYYSHEVTAELQDEVWNVLADTLGVDREKLRSNPSILNELGADSLDLVELVMAIEEDFG